LPGKIYVVDDDASFRTAIQRRLQKEGYQVETFSSAQQLLDRRPGQAESGCILLDVQLPALSGPELQRRLSELGSRTAGFLTSLFGEKSTSKSRINSELQSARSKPTANASWKKCKFNLLQNLSPLLCVLGC